MARINPTQAAHMLGVSRARIHQLIEAGLLPATKWGIYWQIDEKDLRKRQEALKAKRGEIARQGQIVAPEAIAEPESKP